MEIYGTLWYAIYFPFVLIKEVCLNSWNKVNEKIKHPFAQDI